AFEGNLCEPKVNGLVQRSEQSPKYQLHVDWGATKDPQEHPGDRAQHWVWRHPQYGEDATADHTDDHREESNRERMQGSNRDAGIEQIREVGIPAVSFIAGSAD